VRSAAIGGSEATGTDFLIRVVGKHHAGVLHEILDSLHAEGVDVLESKMEHDGVHDICVFHVTSRGAQKDFDNEKLEEIRHHISELVKDPNSMVTFEPVWNYEEGSYGEANQHSDRIQVQLLSHHSPEVQYDLSVKLQELGLVIEQAGTEATTQIVHGHDTQMAHHMFHVTDRQGLAFSEERCAQIRTSLQPVLGHDGGEAIVKMIHLGTTFDWAPALPHTTNVWEISFDSALFDGLLQHSAAAFKENNVNVLYSKVVRSGKGAYDATFYIARVDFSEIGRSLAEEIAGKISAASADPELGKTVVVQPVTHTGKTMRSTRDESLRSSTPIEKLRTGETKDALKSGNGARLNQVAPAPGEMTELVAEA